MSVLYGVFLYMGVSSLTDAELVERVFILLMPQKYQPDLMYLRHVPLRRVHVFTAIQVVCIAIMWTVKAIEFVNIFFPVRVPPVFLRSKPSTFTTKQIFYI